MSGFIKLFGSLLNSTVWQTALPTKVTWITMLAMSDRDGVVLSSVPGLAKQAGVELADCEEALRVFMAPDPYSTTPDHEGRRIEKIEGGWRLLNHAKYREMQSSQEVREKAAQRQRLFRESHKVTPRNAPSRSVTRNNRSNDIAEAEAEAEADQTRITDSAEAVASPPPVLVFPCSGQPREWGLSEAQIVRWEELYPGVKVVAECRNALAWAEANPTRRKTASGMPKFLVAWLTRSQNGARGSPSVGGKTSNNVSVAEEYMRKEGLL